MPRRILRDIRNIEDLDKFIGKKIEATYAMISYETMLKHFNITDWDVELERIVYEYCSTRGIKFDITKDKYRPGNFYFKFKPIIRGRVFRYERENFHDTF